MKKGIAHYQMWPRGVSKENAQLDEWNKIIVPSSGLREWLDHQKERVDDFGQRYQKEPGEHPKELDRISAPWQKISP